MFHGGGWNHGDASQFDAICEEFARWGFVAASANYRYASDPAASACTNRKELCIADARRATAWLVARAARFGFSADRIILGGGSAGGHIATLVGLMPARLTQLTGRSVKVSAFLLLNPAYHKSEHQVVSAINVDPERQLARYVATGAELPPLIAFFGTDDRWRIDTTILTSEGSRIVGIGRGIPFVAAYLTAGGKAELWLAQGQTHAFFSRSKAWEQRCLYQMQGFLSAHGLPAATRAPDGWLQPGLSLQRVIPAVGASEARSGARASPASDGAERTPANLERVAPATPRV